MAHHHHKRSSNCNYGAWATSDDAGHHHHKRGTNCGHGLWATDGVNGHHHHKRGGDCQEHRQWTTSEDFHFIEGPALTAEEFSDDLSVEYDLSQSDTRSYEEVEAELAAEGQSQTQAQNY